MCIAFDWVHLLIAIVVIVGVVLILQLWLGPFIAALPGYGPRILQTINIIIGIAVCIFIIFLCAELLSCVWPSGGFLRHS